MKLSLAVATIVPALLLGGCGKQAPSGQTVASVNGTDITRSELNQELAMSGASSDARGQGRAQALQALINRRLLAQAAEKEGLAKQPETLLAIQRAHDMILAQRALQDAATNARTPPTQREINAYIDTHPSIGPDRRLLSVDQIKFAAPTTQADFLALRPIKTMDQLVQLLESKGARIERTHENVDTAALPDGTLPKLLATRGGEPLVLITGPMAVANVVTAILPVPEGSADVAAVARQRLMAERLDTAVRQRQSALRSAAKLDYAAGFAPTATTTK